MNLSNHKFVIASGCSYATTLSSLDNKSLNVNLDTNGDIIFIEIGCASQGADWAYDSIVYTVEKLFELGVKSENIYCFVEWTQLERVTITQSHSLNDFFIQNTWNVNYHQYHIKGNDAEILSFLHNKLKIRALDGVHNIKSIDNLFYINPLHTDPNSISKFNDVELDFHFNVLMDYEMKIPFEVKVKKYLDNILNLQRYLKSHSVTYNFAMMQSQFSGWFIDETDSIIHKYTRYENKPTSIVNNSYIEINQNYKQKLNISESDDLITVCPQFRPLFDKIDFTHWWFYERSGYRYGGIDEYALEEFGIYGYLTTEYDIRNVFDNLDVSHINPSFGYHPHAFIHVLLTNDMMFSNKFFRVTDDTINHINEMVNEDIHSKNKTKHNLTVSASEMEKYIKIKYL